MATLWNWNICKCAFGNLQMLQLMRKDTSDAYKGRVMQESALVRTKMNVYSLVQQTVRKQATGGIYVKQL